MLLTCLSLCNGGCGYFQSGTWEDDPGNFKRAWGIPPPSGIVVVHSWYCRSPHFTREESYFFQFRKNDEFLNGFVSTNNMMPDVPMTGAVIASLDYGFHKPGWFAPGKSSTYESWKGPAESWLFRDTGTGEFFLYVCQR